MGHPPTSSALALALALYYYYYCSNTSVSLCVSLQCFFLCTPNEL